MESRHFDIVCAILDLPSARPEAPRLEWIRSTTFVKSAKKSGRSLGPDYDQRSNIRITHESEREREKTEPIKINR